ncbi:CU044_5270 family protein [Streptomyces sp. NPDC048330]|uniref:CU044_5270 family protein n=1 Tax=Streptomyces sp. NPDC048330 TaxID=3365533 RepID=UPI00371BC652
MNAFAPRTPQAGADDPLRAELAELLPPPPVPEPTPERSRQLRYDVLRSALDARDDATAGTAGGTRAPRRRPRAGWIAAPAVACAVVAGVVVLAPGEPPAGTPGRVSVDRSASPDAVRVLSGAALAAASAPVPDVGAGGFVYVRSLVAFAGRSADGGPATLPPAHRREVWLSADGSRPGLLREAGAADAPLGAAEPPVYELDRRGAEPRRSGPATRAPSVTEPTHAYVAALPTDPDALLRLVRDGTRAGGGDADQRAFTAIGTLLAETWAPPKVTAALYRAAARIPGVTVLPSATDAAGREGVAVARTAHGEQTQWIFDRTTSAFLGQRTVLTETTSAGAAGTVLGVSAVLAKAAAPAAGVLPKG